VPERAAPVLGSTVIVTLPEPFVPLVTASHGTPLDAAHVQPFSVVTWAVVVPPEALTVAFAGDTEKVHGAAAWLIVTTSLLTLIVPWRETGLGFAPMWTSSDPLPCPDVAEPSVSHEAALDADHVQSRVVSTVTVAAAPDAGAVVIELVTVTSHFGAVGAVTSVVEEVHAATPTEMMSASVSRIQRASRSSIDRVSIDGLAAMQSFCLR
jgi:hypothetical protein